MSYETTVNSLFKDKFELEKEVEKLKHENRALRSQSDIYFDEWQDVKKELKDYQDDYKSLINQCIYWEDEVYWLDEEYGKLHELLQDFSEFINYKLFINPSSDTYKQYRDKLDKLGVK